MNNSVTIGIDNRDGIYFVARVQHNIGRPDIKALIRFDADHFNGHHLLEGNRIVISVPDNQTMIKQIHMHSSEHRLEKVQFELETSLLDSTDNFLFDVIQTNLDNHYVGLTIRKKVTEKLIEPFVKQNGDLNFSTAGVMRAAALARGFLTYCKQSGGEFGAVIDFGKESASIAFIYQQQIVDLCGLPLKEESYNSKENFQKLIIELKTLLNYKSASLLEKGISLPLSKLFVIGEHLDDSLLTTLSENLKIETVRPEINKGFISDQKQNEDIPLDKYLVALGLTAV